MVLLESLLAWGIPALYGAMTGNAIYMSHRNKLEHWLWKRVYGSKRFVYDLKEVDSPEIYKYFLSSLSVKAETDREEGVPPPDDLRRYPLDSSTLYLLSQSECPIRNHFFDHNEKSRTKVLLLPNEPFFIKSTEVRDSEYQLVWCWIKCFPITNGVDLLGYEFWTYQWFRGLDSASPYPELAQEALNKTVEKLQSYEGINAYRRYINIAHQKIQPNGQRDLEESQRYSDFVNRLLDASYVREKIPPVSKGNSVLKTSGIVDNVGRHFWVYLMLLILLLVIVAFNYVDLCDNNKNFDYYQSQVGYFRELIGNQVKIWRT